MMADPATSGSEFIAAAARLQVRMRQVGVLGRPLAPRRGQLAPEVGGC